jgi:magnesium-transporting ATPase (P-type)
VGTSPEEIAFCNYARKYGAILTNTQEKDKTKTLDENFGEMNLTGQREYEVLTKFDYDVYKQRNSAVFFVKDERGDSKVVIYSKGTINGLKSTINRSSKPNFEVGVAKLRKDLEFGFKCTLFARKDMSMNQFTALVKSVDPNAFDDIDFDHPISSLRHMLTSVSQTKIESLRNKIENDLDFLGSACTKEYIERKLHETFEFFKNSRIQTWIVSGDYLNTCIYVCRRLNMVGAESETKIIMTMDHPNDVTPESIANFKTRFNNSQNDSKNLCLAVSGSCLRKIFEMEESNPNLYLDFLYILFAGTITIFGELTSVQKMKLVEIYRRENPSKVVLAVGHEANDELMLSAAHVGVSLFKGQHYLSCRSADIYVQKFHQLRVLLFGFGIDAYRKSAEVFKLSLYSAILLVIPEIVTAPFSYFFPRRLLPDWVSSVVGLVIPLFGMVVYSINDRVFEQSEVIKCGGFYDLSRNQLYSSTKSIIKTIINSAVTGILLTLLGLSLFDYGTYKDGAFFGWFNFGNMVTFGILLILAMRFLSISNTFSFFLFLIPVSMLMLYFFMWLLMSLISKSILFDTFMEVALSPQLYIFIIVIICLGFAESLFLKIDFFSYLNDLDTKETFQNSNSLKKQVRLESNSEKDPYGRNESEDDLMKDDYRDSDSD